MMNRFQISCAVVVCVCGALLCGMTGKAHAAGASSNGEDSCISESCHKTMGKEKFVHGPIAVGHCTSCHIPVAKHKFRPIQDVKKLCGNCHESGTTKTAVHPRVTQGTCVTCHDPHQSPSKFQLRSVRR